LGRLKLEKFSQSWKFLLKESVERLLVDRAGLRPIGKVERFDGDAKSTRRPELTDDLLDCFASPKTPPLFARFRITCRECGAIT
jgi:hypothetical protein